MGVGEHDFLIAALALVIAELAYRISWRQHFVAMSDALQRYFRVVRSDLISDHWKELSLPRYAGTMLAASFRVLCYLLLLLALLLVPLWLVMHDFDQALAYCLRSSSIVLTLGVAVVYTFLRLRMAHV